MDFVEQVKSSVDIVRVIGEYTRLKKLGSGARYVGLCPFHVEKTPSFSVHSTLQFYKCFGCGAGGDVFKFVMELEGVPFFEALKMIAERNGIPVPKREYNDPESKLRSVLHDMYAFAVRQFQAQLQSSAGSSTRAYLSQRGVTPEQIEEFGIGLSADSWEHLGRALLKEGFAVEQVETSGLVRKRNEGNGHYDYFRARLMFPIHDESGKPIAFGGRALKPDDEPKYLNSPETPLYRKQHVLFNLHRARNAARKIDTVVLVEGYMDAIAVYAAGVQHVVATCGTALTDAQVRTMKRHCGRVVVNFDPDAAGANAAERSLSALLTQGMHVRVLGLDGGLDPDEYIKKFGAATYASRLEKAPVYYYWLADRARGKFDMRSADGRVQAWKTIAPAIEGISDKIERFAVAKDMAAYIGVDEALVLERFRRNTGEPRPAATRPSIAPNEKLLLNSLLVSERARIEVLPELERLPAVDQFATRGIFKTLFSMRLGTPAFRFTELQARLSDADRDLLSAILFADEDLGEDMALEMAHACLRPLQNQGPKSELVDLRSQIRSAEKNGDLAEALRLTEELERRLRQ